MKQPAMRVSLPERSLGLCAIRVDQCQDDLMWYANKIGMTLPLARPAGWSKDVYWCREDGGYLNLVKKSDSTLCD